MEKQKKQGLTKEGNFTKCFFKKWLKDYDTEMYSTHNERKSVVAKRFIRTLEIRIYKYMTSISKHIYISINQMILQTNKIIHTIQQLR